MKAAQPLFTLDDRAQLAEVALRDAAVKVAEAQLADLKEALGFNEALLNKQAVTVEDTTRRRNAVHIAETQVSLAKAQLSAYAQKSMDVLGKAGELVVPFQAAGGHTMYRARFGLFGERQAREVCDRLTQRGQTCFAAVASR